MRALEQRTVFSNAREFDIKKSQKLHRERLRSPRKTIDNDLPHSFAAHHQSVKLELIRAAKQAAIRRENVDLANRIYKIMASPSPMCDQLAQPTHYPPQSSTNFAQRVRDARRIHEDNMTLARRLEGVEPHYTSLPFHSPRTQQGEKEESTPRAQYLRQLECLSFLTQAPGHKTGEVDALSVSSPTLLLEYSKVQKDMLLDIKVVKSLPYYIVYGSDFFHQLPYRAVLTYEQICLILGGKVPPHLLDQAEVWLKLLDKITLQPVDTASQVLDLAQSSLPLDEVREETSELLVPDLPVDNNALEPSGSFNDGLIRLVDFDSTIQFSPTNEESSERMAMSPVPPSQSKPSSRINHRQRINTAEETENNSQEVLSLDAMIDQEKGQE